MKVGHVPLIPYFLPGDARVADLIEQQVKQYQARGLTLRAVLCDRLGPQVWGATPAAAMATLEELEETAKLWLRGDRKAQPLNDAAIQALREKFNASW